MYDVLKRKFDSGVLHFARGSPVVCKLKEQARMLHRIPRKHPLLTRITLYIFAFATLTSVLTSGLQLLIAYQAEKKHVVERLDAIHEAHLNTLVNNVWSLDQQAIQIQLNDISGTADIIHVKLEQGQEQPFILGSPQIDGPALLQRRYNLEKTIEGKKFSLGTLTVQATTKNIQDRLLLNYTKTLATQILTLFCTCLFVLFLFLVMFNRPINQIVKFTENLEIGQLDQALILSRRKKKGSRPDELDRIVGAFNNMRERLRKGIAGQQAAEQGLFREKLFSDAIINSLPGILFVINEEGRTVRFNQLFQEKLVGSEERIDLSCFIDHIAEKDRQLLNHTIETLFEDKQSARLEVVLLGSDDMPIPYLLTFQKLVLECEKYLIAVGIDLSEGKKIEEQLRQAQKMEAIGTLAGGVAHDFNNILSAIFGYTDLARLEAKDQQKLQDYLTGIHKAAQRARELVAQILAFSRKTKSEKIPLKLSLIVKETLKLLRSTLPTTIDIRQEIDSEGAIVADPTEIHQVIMNLCTNAFHAMEISGGVLTIHLRERFLASSDILPGTRIPPGPYLQLTVEDTGSGMSEATRQKIFEPYFTTKAPGTGTGLGLAVAHGIVTSHNGHITLTSDPGKGTIFHVWFPIAAEQPAAMAEQESILPTTMGGQEEIMLVDDEEDILRYFSEILGRFGYRVTTFSRSLEALDYFRTHPETIDLIITDQTMPDMTGDRFGREVMRLRADIPVIACSGFSRSLTRGEFLQAGFRDYLQKPFDIEFLLQRIREILDAPPQQSVVKMAFPESTATAKDRRETFS